MIAAMSHMQEGQKDRPGRWKVATEMREAGNAPQCIVGAEVGWGGQRRGVCASLNGSEGLICRPDRFSKKQALRRRAGGTAEFGVKCIMDQFSCTRLPCSIWDILRFKEHLLSGTPV